MSEVAEKGESSSIRSFFEEIQAKNTRTEVKSSPPAESEIKLYMDQKLLGREKKTLKWWEEHKKIFVIISNSKEVFVYNGYVSSK